MDNMKNIRRGKSETRSIRVGSDAWAKLQERAEEDGVTPNYVMEVFCNAYADGTLNLPKIVMEFE